MLYERWECGSQRVSELKLVMAISDHFLQPKKVQGLMGNHIFYLSSKSRSNVHTYSPNALTVPKTTAERLWKLELGLPAPPLCMCAFFFSTSSAHFQTLVIHVYHKRFIAVTQKALCVFCRRKRYTNGIKYIFLRSTNTQGNSWCCVTGTGFSCFPLTLVHMLRAFI